MEPSLDLLGEAPAQLHAAEATRRSDTGSNRSGAVSKVRTWRWVVLFAILAVPAICGAFLWIDDDFWATRQDPVVEVTRAKDKLISSIATFAPRVGLTGGIEYSHTFKLLNDGPSDIVIAGTSKSCGCLSGDIDRKIIHRGESAAVPLRVKTGNAINKSGSLTVSTSAGVTYLFQLKTWTYQPVMLEGDNLSPLSAGLLTPGGKGSITRNLFVYSEADKSPPTLRWEPENGAQSLACILTDLGVEPVDGVRIRRRHYRIKVDVTAQSTPGLQIQRLTFKCVEPGRSEYDFAPNVTWSVKSPISITPARWILKKGELLSNRVTKQVSLTHASGLRFRIRKVECSHDAISVSGVSQGSAIVHDLQVTIAPNRIRSTKSLAETVKFSIEPSSGDRSASSVELLHVIIAR